MARDRKRAKQRRRRRDQQQRPEAAPAENGQDPVDEEIVDEVVEDEIVDEELVEDEIVDEDEIVHDDHEDDPAAAPDPLAHASADIDIAELAEAAVQEPGAPEGPLGLDEYPQPDELEGADALQEAPAKGSRTATVRPGAELPREGNRFVNFLRACVAELRRVQWPDRRQVGQATGVVLAFVIVAGGYLGLLDAVFSRLVNAIL